MTGRRTYWHRLKDHPGVPVATFMTIAGGFSRAGSWSLVRGFRRVFRRRLVLGTCFVE